MSVYLLGLDVLKLFGMEETYLSASSRLWLVTSSRSPWELMATSILITYHHHTQNYFDQIRNTHVESYQGIGLVYTDDNDINQKFSINVRLCSGIKFVHALSDSYW